MINNKKYRLLEHANHLIALGGVTTDSKLISTNQVIYDKINDHYRAIVYTSNIRQAKLYNIPYFKIVNKDLLKNLAKLYLEDDVLAILDAYQVHCQLEYHTGTIPDASNWFAKLKQSENFKELIVEMEHPHDKADWSRIRDGIFDLVPKIHIIDGIQHLTNYIIT